MAKKNSYTAYLKEQFGELIDGLDLNDQQKQFLKSRWLDQLLWLEKKAGQCQKQYYRLRLVTIIGGVIIPALVSLNFQQGRVRTIVFWGTFGLAQVVAISAAVEEFFHYGDKWTQYRKTAETLKTEGWQFFQLSGVYKDANSHESAYRSFAGRIEQAIQEDVSVITEVVQNKQTEEEKEKIYETASTIGSQYQPTPRPIPGAPMPPPPRPREFDRSLSTTPPEPTVPRYGDDFASETDTDLPPAPPITSSPPRRAPRQLEEPDTSDLDNLEIDESKPPGAPITSRWE
ncbi:DUF4231 domain-containing protein [Baaleninema simplex]|uniref:DUF4231 domain-containing protein n=1 Tax=Baaleninema simplex TaxID=2862350 RepID=UPI00034884EF|nr:DUF4231 domain-containing protein [Baaleninema simplex]